MRAFTSLLVILSTAFACRHVPVSHGVKPVVSPRVQREVVDTSGKRVAAPSQLDEPVNAQKLCALPVNQRVSLGQAKVFAPDYPHCPPEDAFCDSIEVAPKPRDFCFVANQNIALAESESLTQPRKAALPQEPWNPKRRPRYFDRIDAHFHFTGAEHVKLKQNGFVVLDRLSYVDYATAFHDIFQEQLPLYVSIDPIMHAVFQGTEIALQGIEKKQLRPALGSLLKKLRSGLVRARGRLSAQTAADLDLYLGVALGLSSMDYPENQIEENHKLSVLGNQEAVARLLEMALGEKITDVEAGIELFGRPRVIDFSQLTPRGHYANDSASMAPLESYFRAVMWLSRLEFNLVSRACRSSQPGAVPNPAETPREVADALALAEIAAQSGAFVELREFEAVYSAFAGNREDVSLESLFEIAKANHISSGDASAQVKLKAAVGDKFQRQARVHFMPQNSQPLPVITTMFGPRIVPDVAPLTKLVHDHTNGRFELGAADVAYVLGHERAREYLKPDLAKHVELQKQLDEARQDLKKNAASRDLYSEWLRAIMATAEVPRGVVPHFFSNPAYHDFRINSALVGYGQMRHVFQLLAAQGYDGYGCEIPDGYVEPLLGVWDALLAYVRRLRGQTKAYAGMERVLKMLRGIAETELSGAPLSKAQSRWLGMVAEYVPIGGFMDTSEPPKWTGWYFDMFEDREIGAERTSAFVADYFTLTNLGKVKYLGAEGPRLGVFNVDVGGEPRLMVGPVAKGYETETEIATRLNDEQALENAQKTAPWRTSFAVAEPLVPQMGLQVRHLECQLEPGKAERRFAIRAARPLGRVTLTLLDHHGDPLSPSLTVDVGADWAVVAFDLPKGFEKRRLSPGMMTGADDGPYGADALDVRVDELDASGLGHGAWHFTTGPGNYGRKAEANPLLPRRPHGIGDFSIGMSVSK